MQMPQNTFLSRLSYVYDVNAMHIWKIQIYNDCVICSETKCAQLGNNGNM